MSNTTTKLTRTQRVTAKISEGLTHTEAEIAVVQEDADAKVAQLKEKQKRETAKLQTLILELLAEGHPDIFAELNRKARGKLAAETRARSTRATRAGGAPAA